MLLNITWKSCLTILLITLDAPFSYSHYLIKIDAEKTARKLSRFWDNTGFSPPAPGKEAMDYLMSNDVKMNLAIVGSLPFEAIKHVRIHWLLDLVQIRKVGTTDTIYEFDFLDKVLDNLVKFGLRPGFELMGNPSGYFKDLNYNRTEVLLWKKLITSIATRYLNRYGADEIMKWRFETWNEPDLLMYNIFNFTLAGYLSYVEASRAGLNDACTNHKLNGSTSCNLKLGGPAGIFKKKSKHKLCWGLLDFCKMYYSLNHSHHSHRNHHHHNRLNNTMQQICQLSFLSFHKKGNGSPKNVVNLSEEFYKVAKKLYKHHPIVQFFNDEADILTGWWRNESWRGDVRYAAAVSQVVIKLGEHLLQNHFFARNDSIFISNDNAFINYAGAPYYFTQRTLLSRFIVSDNNCIGPYTNRNGTHSQFFQKPVYVAMGILAYLYDYSFNVSYLPYDERLSVIATKRIANEENDSHGLAYAILVVFSSYENVTVINETKFNLNIEIKLPQTMLLTGSRYAVYQLDNALPHPFSIWMKYGAPVDPNSTLRALMRDAQGPQRIVLNNISQGSSIFKISINVTLPSISLIHLCQYISGSSVVPGKVNRASYINVTFNEVILLWSDHNINTRCLKTYEIEFCHLDKQPIHKDKAAKKCKFKRLNKIDITFLSFQYAPSGFEDNEIVINEQSYSCKTKEWNRGLYRIRAVDYWDRPGPFSDLLYYG